MCSVYCYAISTRISSTYQNKKKTKQKLTHPHHLQLEFLHHPLLARPLALEIQKQIWTTFSDFTFVHCSRPPSSLKTLQQPTLEEEEEVVDVKIASFILSVEEKTRFRKINAAVFRRSERGEFEF